jgi:hypothetical protein
MNYFCFLYDGNPPYGRLFPILFVNENRNSCSNHAKEFRRLKGIDALQMLEHFSLSKLTATYFTQRCEKRAIEIVLFCCSLLFVDLTVCTKTLPLNLVSFQILS